MCAASRFVTRLVVRVWIIAVRLSVVAFGLSAALSRKVKSTLPTTPNLSFSLSLHLHSRQTRSNMVLRHLDLAVRPALRAASTAATRPRLPPFEGVAFAAPPSPSVTGLLAQVYLPDMQRIEYTEPAPVLIVSLLLPTSSFSSGVGLGSGLSALARSFGRFGVGSTDCEGAAGTI